ncbi:nicotinate-nucleotide adenylyltransferase [Maricaulis sp. CAU 1757]
MAAGGGRLRSEGLAPGLKIGLFGGSFDPPHAGHRHVADTALRRLGLDQVWWLVSPQNPLKQHQPDDLGRRLAAVRRVARSPRMRVSDIEARWDTRRTIDLVVRLQARFPDVHFVWIMGADNLASIHHWARWREIFDRLPVAVVSRPGDAIRARLSRAAELYRHSRLLEHEARSLALAPAPAWTYLTERLHSQSSSALRARA